MTTKVVIKNDSTPEHNKKVVEIYQVNIVSGKKTELQPVILLPGDEVSMYVYDGLEYVIREGDK
jgi:hypothetical protein